MNIPPRWFRPLAAVLLLWNLLGLAAVVADLLMSPADVATLPAPEQALYAARPAWSIVASLVAVVGGCLGCLGLLLRARWAPLLLWASLLGVVLQDLGLWLQARAAAYTLPTSVWVLQGLVLLVAVALVGLARRARDQGWLKA